MSDLYLVLRHRLDEVKDWVTLGQDVMKGARNSRGWSCESVARKIPVAAKTYDRWEKRGQVPISDVEKVAAILGLQIERPQHVRIVHLQEGEGASDLSDLRDVAVELRDLAADILRRLPR